MKSLACGLAIVLVLSIGLDRHEGKTPARHGLYAGQAAVRSERPQGRHLVRRFLARFQIALHLCRQPGRQGRRAARL